MQGDSTQLKQDRSNEEVDFCHYSLEAICSSKTSVLHVEEAVQTMCACTCGVYSAALSLTYQFHLVGTESLSQSASPFPPHIISGGKDNLIGLTINTGSKKALLTL